MKQLVIAEKPSVAKDLARVLGANQKTKSYYEGKHAIVTWGYGHLVGLMMPEDYNQAWKTWSMETLPLIPKYFKLKPLPKTKGQLSAIKKLAFRKDISEVVIATDAGREGELVARWILDYIGYHGKMKRLWISSQTDQAIKEGFKHLKPSKAYDDLYASAKARAKADWLIGLNVSRALTVKYEDQLAAGRVQTPTLAMVRAREKEIETFTPKAYYQLKVTYKGHPIQLEHARFSTVEKAEEKMKSLQNQQVKVVEIKEKIKKQYAPLLYDLTELQQVANQRFGFSAKKTLNLVQSLYERHKIVSYPRTDSKYLPKDMEKVMKEHLKAISGVFEEARSLKKIYQRAVFNDKKVTDHYGLIPTEKAPNVDKLSSDEWKIYQTIVERFIGLFKKPYEAIEQKVKLKIGKEIATLTQIHVNEWGFKQKEAVSELSIHKDQMLSLQYQIEKGMTLPKPRLNESTLLSKMEHHHLGTPATRAEIIEKLISSDMMERQGKDLVVTPKGKQLLTLVNPSLVTPELTEEWELHLQKIEQGKESEKAFIHRMKQEAKILVTEIKESDKTYKDFSMTQKRCPECQSFLKEKKTKQGTFYVCSNTECTYKRRKDPKVSNHRCPECHKKMIILEGKNGAYFKCQQCAITEKIPNKKEKQKKMTKAEEKRLMKKYSEKETFESPLAAALKDLNL